MMHPPTCDWMEDDDFVAREGAPPAREAARPRVRSNSRTDDGTTVAHGVRWKDGGFGAWLISAWRGVKYFSVFRLMAHKMPCIRADEGHEAVDLHRLRHKDAKGVTDGYRAFDGPAGKFGNAAQRLCRVLELFGQHTRTKAGIVIGTPSPIVPLVRRFSHEEACRVSRLALKQSNVRTVVIDLKYATDATTSAFARLVLLRRLLRATGRDLRLVNLRARTEHLYEINKLEEVLPRA
jgi:anti-anti-sigma regulatory factor